MHKCLIPGLVFVFVMLLVAALRTTKESFVDPTDIIIVTAHYTENLKWLLKARVPVVVCSKDSAASSGFKPNESCTMMNVGREASAYLKFIISHYDDLPKHVAFIHGHENAWHQKLPFGLLHAIQDCALVDEHDYIPLNDKYFERTTGQINTLAMDILRNMWGEHFLPYIKRKFPENLKHDCCAQFIVSRGAILKHPKSTYEHWLTLFTDSQFYSKYQYDDYSLGLVFEFIWHIIFGEPDRVNSNLYKFRKKCFSNT